MEKIDVQTHPKEKSFKKTTFAPTSKIDTFMSCVSYWVYGSVIYRKFIRKKLMLFFAKKCFKHKFKSFNEIANAYVSDKIEFYKNPYVKTMDNAIKFIFKNSIPGIISSFDIMIKIVSDCLCVCVAPCKNWQNSKIFKENIMHLIYDFENKECKLLFVDGLRKIKRKTMYQLMVSKIENEIISVCEFQRIDQIHTCCIDETNSKWIYTVFPTNGYKQLSKCFIYIQKNKNNAAKCVSSTDGKLNPYFMIDNDDSDKYENIYVHLVHAETLKESKNLLQYKRKIKTV